MPRRKPATLADYAVVGINPALIMVLIGSVAFFLLAILYRGEYPERLSFIFAMFIMGAVAVGRLSMEEGNAYAATFGAPLAAVVFLGIQQLSDLHPLATLALIAVVWGLAHQLTYDCTLLDERADTSDQGLLQAVGAKGDAAAAESDDDAPLDPRFGHGKTKADDDAPPWLKWFSRSKQPHPHGVWVVYFAIVALPLFGLLQTFVPGESRRYAFFLLMICLAATLGLLLSTSFLGLRRYLRKRRLEMPGEMTAVWLGVGGAMIAAVLLACLLLPRPGAEVAVSQIPFTFSTRDLLPSRWSVGSDGQKKDPEARASGSSDEEGNGAGDGKGPPSGEGGTQGERGSGESKTSGQGQGEGGQGSQGQNSQNSQQQGGGQSSSQSGQRNERGDAGKAEGSNQRQGENGNSKGSSQGATGQADRQSGDRGAAEKSEPNQQSPSGKSQSRGTSDGKSQAPQSRGGGGQSGESQSQSGKQGSSDQQQGKSGTTSGSGQTQSPSSGSSPPSAASNPLSALGSLTSSLGILLKVLFYAALALAIAYFAWKHRHALAAAWRQLLKELGELWARLFGGSRGAAATRADDAAARPAPQPFAAYMNPFASGMAGRLNRVELLRHTFEAMQAWGREQGCARLPYETPHEYVQRLGAAAPHIAREGASLAEFYGLAAYAGAQLPDSVLPPLRSLWDKMQMAAA